MNRITRNNYESYIIDLVDGNLDTATTKALMAFLDANPDIKAEVEQYEDISLYPPATHLPGKEELKKQPVSPAAGIDEDNYEEIFTAYHENDLSETEKEKVLAFLRLNPHLDSSFRLSGKLQVNPDLHIVYEPKAQLKKRIKLVPLFYRLAAGIAAVMLIAFTITSLLDTSSTPPPMLTNGTLTTVSKSVVESVTKPSSSAVEAKKKEKLPSKKETGQNGVKPIIKKKRVLNPTGKVTIQVAVLAPQVPENMRLTSNEFYCRLGKSSRAYRNIPLRPEKKKSFVGKLMAGLFNKAKEKVEPVLPIPLKQINASDEPLLAKVFDKGAQVLNNYTGTEASVTKYYDNQGNLVAYHFSGGNIKFSKWFKKN